MSSLTIPALTTIVDRQFKEYRTLCPLQALRYYLDRTKDLRGSRSLLFISFNKGHTSDFRPATLSFWFKETILLCYKQADQQSLVQVKAHDITAFAAPKAFYGGVFGLKKLSYFVTNKQINSPWSKLKCMTLRPSRPLRPFTVGFWWTKSCKLVTGKLTTHLQIFT